MKTMTPESIDAHRHDVSRRYEYVMVTPEAAVHWLNEVPHARELNHARVHRYANDMNRNEWLDNGDTIKIGTDGLLVNGHHRLKAVVLLGRPVPLGFIYGIDPATKLTLDTGMGKRNGDWDLRPDARLRHSITAGLLRRFGAGKVAINSPHTNLAVESAFDAASIAWAAGQSMSTGCLKTTPALTAAALIHRCSPARAEMFVARLREHNAPVGTPENAYLRWIAGHRRVNRQSMLEMAEAVATVAVEGRVVSNLRPIANQVRVRNSLELDAFIERIDDIFATVTSFTAAGAR